MILEGLTVTILVFIGSFLFLYFWWNYPQPKSVETKSENKEINKHDTKKQKKSQKNKKQNNSVEKNDVNRIISNDSSAVNERDGEKDAHEVNEEIEAVHCMQQEAVNSSPKQDAKKGSKNGKRKANKAAAANDEVVSGSPVEPLTDDEKSKNKLYHELEEAKEKIADCESKIQKFQLEIKLNNEIKAKLEDNLKLSQKSNSKIEELESQLSKTKVVNGDLTQQLDCLRRKFQETELNLEKEKELNERLAHEKDNAATKRKDENNVHTQTYRQFEETIERYKSENVSLKNETVNMNRLLEANNQKLKKLQDEIQNLEDNRATIVEKMSKSESEVKKVKEEMNDEIRQLSSKNKDFENKFSTSQIENEKKVRKLEKDNENLVKQMNEKEKFSIESHERLSQELKEKIDELTSLKNKMVDIGDLGKTQLKMSEKHIKQLETDLNDKNAELKSLNDTCNNMTKSYNQTVEELIRKLKDLEDDKQLLEREVSTKVELAAVQKKERSEADSLKLKNSELYSSIQAIEINLQQQTGESNSLKQKLKESLENLNSVTNEKHQLSDELHSLKIQLTELRESKTKCLETTASEKQNLEEKIRQIEESKSKSLKEKENEIHSLQTIISNLNETLKENEMSLRSFVEQNDELHKQLSQKITEICQSKAHFDKEKSEQDNRHKHELQGLSAEKSSVEEQSNNKCIELLSKIRNLEINNERLSQLLQIEVDEKRLKSNESETKQQINHQETERYREHIKVLESELLRLQGLYFELKQKEEEKSVSVSKNEETNTDGNDEHSRELENKCKLYKELIDKLNGDIAQEHRKNQLVEQVSHKQALERKNLDSEFHNLQNKYQLLQTSFEDIMSKYNCLSLSTKDGEQFQTNYSDLMQQVTNFRDENTQLKSQLNQYKQTLEKTELVLEKIQESVDQEENKWKESLELSEIEKHKLEKKIEELLTTKKEDFGSTFVESSPKVEASTECDIEQSVVDEIIPCQNNELLEMPNVVQSVDENMETLSNTVDVCDQQTSDLVEENEQLKSQLNEYRDTLESTECSLQKIQDSVSAEEQKWKESLQVSENEKHMLEEKLKEFQHEKEELKALSSDWSGDVEN